MLGHESFEETAYYLKLTSAAFPFVREHLEAGLSGYHPGRWRSMNTNSTDFAQLVTGFLTDFLPLQRNYSRNTVLSYKDALKLFAVFLTESKKIRLTDFTMQRFNRVLIIEYLEWLRNRGCSVATANQRLAAIKSFSEYAGVQCLECLGPLQLVQGIKSQKSLNA